MTKEQRYEEMYRLLEFMYDQFTPTAGGSFIFIGQADAVNVSDDVYEALCQIEDVLYLDEDDDEFTETEEF